MSYLDSADNTTTNTNNKEKITKSSWLILAVLSLVGLSSMYTDTDTPNAINTDDSETATITTTTTTTDTGTEITMPNSQEFEPEDTKVPLNDKIVWINEDYDDPHTATSGTGPDDPNSAKIFDTGIIEDRGERSDPIQLTGVKVGDEIPYYCTLHPSMTGKLIVTSPTTNVNTAVEP